MKDEKLDLCRACEQDEVKSSLNGVELCLLCYRTGSIALELATQRRIAKLNKLKNELLIRE